MNINVIDEINSGNLSEAQVIDIIESILDTEDAPNVTTILGISNIEWTAYAQGASFGEIAEWRRSGWPKNCAVCGREINISNFGWWVTEMNGVSAIRHIKCPS